jgi:hypothetical protein
LAVDFERFFQTDAAALRRGDCSSGALLDPLDRAGEREQRALATVQGAAQEDQRAAGAGDAPGRDNQFAFLGGISPPNSSPARPEAGRDIEAHPEA